MEEMIFPESFLTLSEGSQRPREWKILRIIMIEFDRKAQENEDQGH